MSYLCGCYYHVASTEYHIRIQKHYLPLVDSTVHSTILSTTSRTVLKQKFTNPSSIEAIKECIYTFPLYDGVSVVSFTCRIGKKILRGLVKEKVKAKQIFNDAVVKGETAGLLEQAPEASDVFSTKLGNIPASQSVIVEITYIGELKYHETDGIRFTIPTKIAPRYGPGPAHGSMFQAREERGIKITVDVNMPEGSFIKAVESPSHPIAVSMGTVSTATAADPLMSKASATLSLESSALEKDFVLIVQSKDVGIPKAILETHPTIRNHRALMATLVPKFSLPPSRPEIVFVADRSGSMQYNMEMLISAMKVFLKSMPVGVKFNICSFGSSCSFLWPKSQSYNQETLQQATDHLIYFRADMGGTETFGAIKATIERRFTDIPLEIMLLTDGDIWRQEDLFKYVNHQVEQTNGNIRIFPLGIGNGVSHALIEGLARAGNGFAQAVQNGERLDNSVVRMLRGALSPHITDYTLEVRYDKENDNFELIDKVTEGMKVLLSDEDLTTKKATKTAKSTISLFDTTSNPEKEDLKGVSDSEHWLPKVPFPKLHQAPHKIPTLFAFSRTSVYLLLSPETIQRNPTAVVLRATSTYGPLALEIPIESLSTPAETIHQLAAKKAVQDLEEGRGWIYDAKDQNDILIKDRYPSCFDDLVQREAVRLGEKFQVAGKWCSFVAVAANDKEIAKKESKNIEQKSLVMGDDGYIYADDNLCIAEDLEEAEDDDDEEYEMISGSSAPAPPYQPTPRLVDSVDKSRKSCVKHPREPTKPRTARYKSDDGSGSGPTSFSRWAPRPAFSPIAPQSPMPPQQFGTIALQSHLMFASTSTRGRAGFGGGSRPSSFGNTSRNPGFGSSNSSSEKVLLPHSSGAFGPPSWGTQNTSPRFGRSASQSLFSDKAGGSPRAPAMYSAPSASVFGAQSASPAAPSTSYNRSAANAPYPEYGVCKTHQSRSYYDPVDSSAIPASAQAPPSIGQGPSNLFGGVSAPFGSRNPPKGLSKPATASPASPEYSPVSPGAASVSLDNSALIPQYTGFAVPKQMAQTQQYFQSHPAPLSQQPLSLASYGAALAAYQANPPPPPQAKAQVASPTTNLNNPFFARRASNRDADLDGNTTSSFEPEEDANKLSRQRLFFSSHQPESLSSSQTPSKKRRSTGESLFNTDSVFDLDYAPPVTDWTTKSIAEKVLALIALQTFEGSWEEGDSEVVRIMGMDELVGGKGVDRNVWVTLLVVKWFEILAGEEEGTWGLVVEKARGWLEGQIEVEGWEGEAGKVVEGLRGA